MQEDGTLRTGSPKKQKKAEETVKPLVRDEDVAKTVQLMIVENNEFAARVIQPYGRRSYTKDDVILVLVVWKNSAGLISSSIFSVFEFHFKKEKTERNIPNFPNTEKTNKTLWYLVQRLEDRRGILRQVDEVDVELLTAEQHIHVAVNKCIVHDEHLWAIVHWDQVVPFR